MHENIIHSSFHDPYPPYRTNHIQRGLPWPRQHSQLFDVSKTYWRSWPKVQEWYLGELELWEFTKGEYVNNAGQCQDREKAAFPKGFLCPHSTSFPGWEYEMNSQLLKLYDDPLSHYGKHFMNENSQSEWTSVFKSRLVINSMIQCKEKLLFEAYLPFQLRVWCYFVWLGKGLKPWLWWFW